MLERQAEDGHSRAFKDIEVCVGRHVVPRRGNRGRTTKYNMVVTWQWAALPSRMSLWVLEGSENCLVKGEQREGCWGTQGSPLPWGRLRWETVWGLEVPPA